MFGPLRRHIQMLEFLGIDGMSSDEGDSPENEGAVDDVEYRILEPLWRAPQVTPWLRMFDSIYRLFRRKGQADVGPGAFPRRRKSTGVKSKSLKFVPGLPINMYDQGWLEGDMMRKYDLCPTALPYDFTHDENIMEYVVQPIALHCTNLGSSLLLQQFGRL